RRCRATRRIRTSPSRQSSSTLIFFFQAEDSIRDKLVTGVQTCALPIFTSRMTFSAAQVFVNELDRYTNAVIAGEPSGSKPNFIRSEERRVGKECRSWWLTY